MRFDGEMDRRLQNWARWLFLREDGGRVASASTMERVDGSGWDAPTVIPTLDAEAEETQRGVEHLVGAGQGVQAYALRAWYCTGGGVAQRCRKAQCSETVLRERVALGQRALGQWLQDKREAAEAERKRVERLQRLLP